jgi:hypothetical protein
MSIISDFAAKAARTAAAKAAREAEAEAARVAEAEAAQAAARAARKTAPTSFVVSERQAAAEKARAQAARATKTKYSAVEPHPDPHPELVDIQFPQGAGLGGPFAIQQGVPLVGRKPFMAQSNRGYSGLAASVPANRVEADIVPFVDMAPRVIRSPEEIARQFAAGIPLTGDKLRAGVGIAKVNDMPQVGIAPAWGGPDFPRQQAAMGRRDAWGSLDAVIGGLNNMRAAGEKMYNGPVAGVYTAMGNTGLDQSTAMMDLLGRQLAAGGVTKANLKVLDQRVKALMGEDFAKTFTGFAKDPIEAAAQLSDVTRVQMPKRTAIIQGLDSANALAAGFPDIGANRAAATTPELLYAPEGASGHMISGLTGETPSSSVPGVGHHPNYLKTITGDYFGGLEQSVPRELMFPNYFKAMHGSGYDPVQVQAYLFSRTPKEIKEAFGSDPRIQPFDQEWVDKNSKYLEDIAKYGHEPYARGGLAVKQRPKRPSAPRSLAARKPSKEAPKARHAGNIR